MEDTPGISAKYDNTLMEILVLHFLDTFLATSRFGNRIL
jgi:hypothetical protein